MSTDYDVWCVTCERGLGMAYYSSYEGCEALVRAAVWIERFCADEHGPSGIPEMKVKVELMMHGDMPFDRLWFTAHARHELAVRDEYNRVFAVARELPTDSEEELTIQGRIRAAVLAEREACMREMVTAAEALKARP